MRRSAVFGVLFVGLSLVPLSRAAGQGQGLSQEPDMSASGQFVVFQSTKQLVPGVTNNGFNVYLRDTVSGRTSLISRTPGGQAGNDTSMEPSISNDGRFVVFDSWASNLVPGDTNRQPDVFLFDRRNNAMRRLSARGATQGNGPSSYPDISGDGNTVAFQTEATNLIPGDTNGRRDVAVWTRSTGGITQANLTNAGKQANGSSWWRPSVSNDGTRIAFFSDAGNLGTPTGAETVQVRDISAGKTYRMAICPPIDSFNYGLALSRNGRRLAYSVSREGTTPAKQDWRVIEVPSGTVQRQGQGVGTPITGMALSRDGSAYAVAVNGLIVHNRLGDWKRTDLGGPTAITADGLRVATQGPNDAIYLWDTGTRRVTQVDVP